MNVEPELAERTGLEPATSGVTGQHSNQLNYSSVVLKPDCGIADLASACGMLRVPDRTFYLDRHVPWQQPWRPHGDSNPGRHRERVVS